MAINQAPMWADSYEKDWQQVFKDSQSEGFSSALATQKAWAHWVNENANKPQCVAPLSVPLTLAGTTNESAFAPVRDNCKVPPEFATMLATAWQTWAAGIIWIPPPPAPPFSAIASVIIDPPSIAAAYTQLLTKLQAEVLILPPPGGEKIKYKAFGDMFSAATLSLQVMFIGLSMPTPTPNPLTIPVPIM